MLYLRLFVRLLGSNLSRALNLHHSGLDLQAVIKGSSSGLQVVFKQSIDLDSYRRSLKHFVLLGLGRYTHLHFSGSDSN